MKKNILNSKRDNKVKEENKDSFIWKMKNDSVYSAKMQLMGWGIFLFIVIVGVNISGSSAGTRRSKPISKGNEENTLVEKHDVLDSKFDNYHYDTSINVTYKNVDNVDVNSAISYKGRRYNNLVEIERLVDNSNSLYYKVDDQYYTKDNENINYVKEDIIYDIVDSKYIEFDGIRNILKKASLDHVTDYSSGRKVYEYHLKIKDVVLSYQLEDIITIDIESVDNTLKIDIDYTDLLKVVDEEIIDCKLSMTINEIGNIKSEDIDFKIEE